MTHFSESARQIVGVSITPQLGVEVALLDKKTPTVVKYAREEFDYDIANRKVDDYDNLKAVVSRLFRELDISPKSNVYLVVPNVHLAFENVQPMLNDVGVETILLSKAEEQYFFKKSTPKSAWADIFINQATDKRLLVYTSIQEEAIDEFKRIFSEMGATLIGIESSYSAIIRGLAFAGIIEKEEEQEKPWNLLLINTNSYALINSIGAKINDFIEVPVPIKQCSIEEAYQVISTSVAQHLPNYRAEKLVVVSQAENISATVLKDEIIFDYEVYAHNCNKYAEPEEVPYRTAGTINAKLAGAMSFSILGALSVGHMQEHHLQMNFLGEGVMPGDVYFTTNWQGKEIQVSRDFIRTGIYIVTGILVALVALVWLLSFAINKATSEQTEKNKMTMSQVSANIAGMTKKGDVIDIGTLVEEIINQNKKTINFYDSIATDIPNNVWLQYYYNKLGDNVAIEGVSTNIGDIYSYYKSLKVISPNSSIKLNKLQIMSQADEDEYDVAASGVGEKFYEFEIANINSPKAKDANTPLDGLLEGEKQKTTSKKATKKGRSAVPPGLTPPSVDNLPQVDIR